MKGWPLLLALCGCPEESAVDTETDDVEEPATQVEPELPEPAGPIVPDPEDTDLPGDPITPFTPVPPPPPRVEVDPARWEAFTSRPAAGVVDLQPLRAETVVQSGDLEIGWIDLNPGARTWFLLRAGAGKKARTWHLENLDPSISVTAGADGLMFGSGDPCTPWAGSPSPLDQAVASKRPFAPICDGRLLVRNTVVGRKTEIEWSTDLLRDYVPGGAKLTEAVRDRMLVDRYRKAATRGSGARKVRPGPGPMEPMLADPDATLTPTELGLPLEGDPGARLDAGASDGVHALTYTPSTPSTG